MIAHNLARAAGVLAGGKLRKARTATIRTKLINIPGPARLLRAAPTPCTCPRTPAANDRFMTMFDAIQAPPKAA